MPLALHLISQLKKGLIARPLALTYGMCASVVVFCGCDYSRPAPASFSALPEQETSSTSQLSSHTSPQASSLNPTGLPLALQFEHFKGLKLEYPLYIPNALVAWELSERTRLRFDSNTQTYVRKNLLINQPAIDELGPRFKICSTSWSDQWGFGAELNHDESTFGIGPMPTVLEVDYLGSSGSDMYLEYSRSELSNQGKNTVDIEFKVIQLRPSPKALLKITLH